MKILFCLIIFVTSFTVESKAQLTFQNDIEEFHPDITATELNAEFHFTNVGTIPITIKEIKPSCGCTIATISRMTYAPNETGVIKATYTIHGATGLQNKEIAISTVQFANEIKVLTIRAYVPEIAKVSPALLSWQVGEAPLPKSVKLELAYAKPVKVLGIDWTTDKVFAKISSKDDKTFQIIVTPLSTGEPLEGSVWVKILLPGNVLKMSYIPFLVGDKVN
jgi:hypothetical protein